MAYLIVVRLSGIELLMVVFVRSLIVEAVVIVTLRVIETCLGIIIVPCHCR